MILEQLGRKLIIMAGPSGKDIIVFLGVGIVFIIVGTFFLPSPMAWLLIVPGCVAVIMFVAKSKQTQITYIFDQSTQQLHVSNGDAIPFVAIQSVRVHEDKWKGSYGSVQTEHSVRISAGTYGFFVLPVNSLAEATSAVHQINQHLARGE